MFIFDVETLGKRSNSVILSMAAIYFDPDTKPSPQELRDSAFFAKFSVKEQVKEYGREMNQPTMDWWKKQCDNVRTASFVPHEYDCSFVDGYESMRNWASQDGRVRGGLLYHGASTGRWSGAGASSAGPGGSR